VIVCVCRNVSEHEVAASIDAGAKDVATVASHTGAASSCGCCTETIEEMIARAGPCSSTPCAGCPRALSAARRNAA